MRRGEVGPGREEGRHGFFDSSIGRLLKTFAGVMSGVVSLVAVGEGLFGKGLNMPQRAVRVVVGAGVLWWLLRKGGGERYTDQRVGF